MQPDSTLLDTIPGELPLAENLQRLMMFTLGTKTIKQGRLILFKRAHYCLHITLQNNKGVAENFEIPIPFKVEYHRSQGLCYFDYRIKTLTKRDTKKEDSAKKMFIKNVSPSQYYNKILELTILDI
jgi:hypothetical protein